MDTALEQIRNQQKENWNRFSPGWKKWDAMTMNFLKPMGEEIIRLLQPRNGEVILDIAAGTGEPGLTIAEMIKDGKVVITDLADGMLEVAKENAVKRGLTNVETRVCDVSELPFNNASFDAVSCRHGFMFFPDMQLAANEMARVLKPGGRVATSVWNAAPKNFWVTAIMSSLNKHFQMPQPPPGAPSMFRCAGTGFIADIFKKAGLKNIEEKEVNGVMHIDNAETYWNFHNDVSAPVVGALGKADDATKTKIKAEVFETLKSKYPDGNIQMEFSTLVIYGEK
ncbi:MAG: class I SAM-dependent methyltransferase [Agriterribacter sp.]